jgi:hypothetical protein
MLTRNEPIESCLARYPLHAAELKPLLETMQAARVASSLSADPAFRTRARCEFRSALYANMHPSPRVRPGLALRWATIASTVGVFVLTAAGGAVAASSGSMPGQPLYQLKRDVENVQLTLTPSQSAKARLYATLADRRVSEIVYAAQSGDAQLTKNLTDQFSSDLSMVSAIATPSRSLTLGGNSKQAGTPSVAGSTPEQATSTTTNTTVAINSATNPPVLAPVTTALTPPVTVASAPAPTVIINNPPQVNVTALPPATTPTFNLPQPNITLSGITDPALLKLLQQYSIRNIAELMAVLDKVPPSTKAALLAAIQAASSGYGQILGS